MNLEAEPRVKRATAEEAPKASHPFFWAGYMLVDCGTSPEKKEPKPDKPVIKIKKPDKPEDKDKPAEKDKDAEKAKAKLWKKTKPPRKKKPLRKTRLFEERQAGQER